MRQITIIEGHPDPSEERLNHALADRYAEVARGWGHEVRRIDLSRTPFPLLRTADEFLNGTPPEPIREAQRDIKWADHIVFFYPLWNGDMPALLKAFIEQTFRPGFAMDYSRPRRFPKALMKGKSARVVVTMGMPAVLYGSYFGAHSLKSLERSVLGFAGFSPIEHTLVGAVAEDAPECRSRAWFERIEQAAERDSMKRNPRRARAIRLLAAAGAFATCAYALYAAAAWSRYGSRSGAGDEMLDRLMPDYEIVVQHRTMVNAPADLTMQTIRDEDFRRFSRLVRSIFRAREVLMGAKHIEQELPQGLINQLTGFGWTVLAEVPGREIVLGTVTQPWQPNPVFRALPPDDFPSFTEPGYAKIAMTLCVEPLSAQTCAVATETRVKTTDPVSRARFRRYWALLSPGIELVRVFLLRQIKADAESRRTTIGEIPTEGAATTG